MTAKMSKLDMSKSNILSAQDRNVGITLSHVIALTLITILHTFQYVVHREGAIYTVLHELETIGVPLFLVTAGYLSGKKDIKNGTDWICKKLTNLLVPYYLILIPVLVVYTVAYNSVSLKQVLILLLNLQGFQNYIICNVELYIVPTGMGHLWYTTIIMLCFLFTPLLKKIFCKLSKTSCFLILLGITILQPLCIYVHIHICYLLIYVWGLYLGVYFQEIRLKYVIIGSFVSCLAVGVRLIGRHLIDGSLLYDFSVAPLSSMVLGINTFCLIMYMGSVFKLLIIVKNRFIYFIEGLLLEFYLIHSIVVSGKINITNIEISDVLQGIVAVILTFVLSYLLNRLSTTFIKLIKSLFPMQHL